MSKHNNIVITRDIKMVIESTWSWNSHRKNNGPKVNSMIMCEANVTMK